MNQEKLLLEIEMLNKRFEKLENSKSIKFMDIIKKSLTRMNVIIGITITVFVSSIFVYAATLVSFTDGDIISAAQVNANFAALNSRIAPVGSIMPFAGPDSKVPDGWMLCDGTAVSRSTYSDLFDVISTSWGNGDTSTTFNLPDLRGTFLRGVAGTSGKDPDVSSRTNPFGGNTGNAVGSFQIDAFQGHRHNSTGSWFVNDFGSKSAPSSLDSNPVSVIGNPTNDGVHGDPRISFETRPKNAAVNFIIKY